MTEPEQPTQTSADPVPTACRFVLYSLRQDQADAINQRRAGARSHNAAGVTLESQDLGAQIHHGNSVRAGDRFPMLIVRTWGDQPNSAVNGQVFLDGDDTLWVSSVQAGQDQGQFVWPHRS